MQLFARLPVSKERVLNVRLLIGVVLTLVMLQAGCTEPEPAGAPQLAVTDLYLVDLTTQSGHLVAGVPVNLTGREGFDNQPAWLPDGEAFIYSAAVDEQVDVFRYDLETGSRVRLTTTEQREYSPAPLPAGQGFSVVRVDHDGNQQLWRFDDDGQNPAVILEWESQLGYYAWIDRDFLALVLATDPTALTFADADRGWVEEEPVAITVGRSVQQIPGRNAISYIFKTGPHEWWVEELDLLTRRSRRLIRTLPKSEDHAWLPDGSLLMAADRSLYVWRTGQAAEWEEFANFSDAGLSGITRLAVSPQGEWLVIVADHTPLGQP